MELIPVASVLCLHTGGLAPLAATGTLAARNGPLLRWMAGSPSLAIGLELEQAMEGLGVGRLRDGREVGAWWLTLDTAGPAPSGRSGDLAIAAAILLRWGQDELAVSSGTATEGDTERPRVVVTGSGRFALTAKGIGAPTLAPVEGWAEKMQHLARSPEARGASRVILLHVASQQDEVTAAVREAFACPDGPPRTAAGAPIELVPLREPGDLLTALRERLGRNARAQASAWQPIFPGPAPDAVEVLTAAEANAHLDGFGYLGVEHTIRAVLGGGGPLAARLKRALQERDLFAPLARASEPPSLITPTPRMIAVGSRLHPGFTASDLVQTILADRHCPLHRLALLDLALLMPRPDDTDATMSIRTWGMEESSPSSGLEVLCGPEDGRVLRPNPGDSIGRWAPEGAATIALFRDTATRDRLFSRTHLIWKGGGRLRVLRPGRLLRGHTPLAISANQELMLLEGDILQASPATWLRGV